MNMKKNTCICVTESLCCTPKTNTHCKSTTLQLKKKMKGYRLKLAKGKSLLGRVQEKPAQVSKCFVSRVTWTHTSPSDDVWQHMQSVANQGSPPEPLCPGFLLGVSHIGRLHLCD